ncbi:MAG: PAS domain S-box protein [Pseudomonadota bacterium]
MKPAGAAADFRASPGAEEALLVGRRAARWGPVLCLIGAAAGAIGLLGWIIGLPFLRTLVPGEPDMKINTALSLVLLGVAGALRYRETPPRAVRAIAIAAALIALLIGLGTIIEYATGRDLAIDQLLPEAGAGPYPGRPSPPTAVAVALLAVASLLFDNRRQARVRPTEWMMLGAGLLAFAALVGTAFGAGPLYRLRSAPITGVAVPTAVGLLLVSAGMFLERPNAGLAQLATSAGPGGTFLRRLALPGMVLPALLAFVLSRLFARAGIHDVALLFATLVVLTTVVGLVLLVSSAAPLDRVHKALAASRAEMRELVEQAPDGIFVANLDGRYTDVNRAGCEMLGFAREELVGKTIVDLIPPEDVGRLAASKERLLTGSAEVSEWRLRRRSGTYLAVELNAKILADGRWQAFVRDISDRKRVETERHRTTELLRQSEEQFRLIFEEAPIGVALVGLDGRFVRVNGALCEILGYTPEELERLSYQEVTAPEDLQNSVTMGEGVRRGDLPKYRLEKRYIRKNGSTVTISVNGSIVRDDQGHPRHYIAQIEDISERQRAEEAVRRSELKFRRLVETMPDGVFMFQAGRIVYANRSLGVLLGYDDQSALLGRSIREIVSPEFLELVQARIRLIQQTGASAPPQEMTMLRRDGSRAVIESVGIGVELEGALAILVVVRDLTERVRAEEAVRSSEARFSGIVSSSADAIISIDERQKITVFNTGAEKIFGYSRHEILGAPLDLLIPERLRERHREHVAGFAGSPIAARRMAERLASIKGRRKNGDEFPAEASISKLRVGDATLLTVVLRDTTERERFEREQRTLAEIGVVLAGTLDYEGTLATVARIAVRDFADWCLVEVLEAQEGLLRLNVVSADPLKGAIAAEFEHLKLDGRRPYLAKPAIDLRQPCLVSRLTPADLEAAAQSPEHLQALRALEPVSMMTVPLMLREQLFGALTFISSNPCRLYEPADLRLAAAIAERASLAIENARLYRAALQATGMRDQVLGVVAHDLRNPLGAILLHASALGQTGQQPERRNQKHKDAIDRAIRRMNHLIQDLLDVAVLEGGQLRVEKIELSPSDLLREAVETQRALAAAASIELRVEATPDTSPILGDRDRLLQVFQNLIGNALKFTDAGGQVTVGVAPGESGALFWVADNGRGMTPEEVGRVFDRFWQASARSGRLGAGLGLPITKGIVEAHGGRIWVESAPGQGSAFFFSIPLAAPRAEAVSDSLH